MLDLEPILLNKLKCCYIERSRDKVISVRNAAACGLCRLQNSIDPDEEVLSQIAINIRHDTNATIRRMYASEILVHTITMKAIIETLKDEEISIRIAMLQNLQDHALIEQLSTELRHAVIHCLEDRNEVIVKAAENVIIKNWCSKNSILLLLSLLDMEKEEVTVRLKLRCSHIGGIATKRHFFIRANKQHYGLHISNPYYVKSAHFAYILLSLLLYSFLL